MFSLTQLSVAQDSNKGLKVVRIKAKVSCNGCKTKIEKNIAFEKGVKYVDADIKTKIVTIKYTKGKNTDKKLLAAVKKLGYGGEIIKGATTSSSCVKPCPKSKSCSDKKQKTSK